MMDLEQHFDSLTLNTIDQYIAEGQKEHLHLEFKTIADPKLNRDDRKHLAIAISGFANSDGGILVWGVDARKNPDRDDADCACGKKEIQSLSLFVSKLNEFTGEAVNPVAEGVQHRSLEVE
jgi:hypothetical protein